MQDLVREARRAEFNPQMRGADVKVAREGAEISYYSDEEDRYAEPEGVIQ